jgi:hypothetical protein
MKYGTSEKKSTWNRPPIDTFQNVGHSSDMKTTTAWEFQKRLGQVIASLRDG